MKHFAILCIIFLSLAACTPKSIHKRSETKNIEAKNLKEALNVYENNQLNFETLETVYKTSYDDGKKNLNVKTVVRIQKEEKIWVSASLFGFEGARLLITPTRVQVMNRIEKYYYDEPIEKLQDIAGLPLDFQTLQNLFVGKILLLNEDQSTFTEQENTIEITSVLEQLINTAILSKSDFVLDEQTLQDEKKDLLMNISYGDYQVINSKLLPYHLNIQVQGEKNINIDLEAQKVERNTNPKFPYSVNKRYTKKEIK